MSTPKEKNSKYKKCQDGPVGITKAPKMCLTDPGKTFLAVVSSNFRQLDPVTGDASCEMKVPFILDAMEILGASDFAPESLNPGFCSMYGPGFNALPDTGSRRRSLPKSGTMPEHYFSLFYPLSVIRQRAEDSFRFLIDDQPERITYSAADVSRWKWAASKYNVDYIRKIAKIQAVRSGDQAPVMGQISRMLDDCIIKVNKSGYMQPVLPIFTAEYFLSQNEYLHGRPITLVLTRLGYDNAGGQHHFGTRVYNYRPNRAENFSDKKFELDQTAPTLQQAKRGVTVVHGFNMFPMDQTERGKYEVAAVFADEERFFNSPDNAEFEYGFVRCNLIHLLRMRSAAHSPAPSSAVSKDYGPGQSREYIEEKHRANRSGSDQRNYKLTDHTLLFGGQDTNLSDEYFAYKNMADRFGVTEIRYASELAEMHKSYYVGPLGRTGEEVSLNEWTTIPNTVFAAVACASGAKGKRDRITYEPKHLRRICQPIPFSVVHVFTSSYEEEKRHADQLNAKYTSDNKFTRDLQTELISGTLFEKPKKKKGQLRKKGLGFWIIRETIDEEDQVSVQFPDSETESGYETIMTAEEREALADKMTEIARTLRAVGDIAQEIIERAIEYIESS